MVSKIIKQEKNLFLEREELALEIRSEIAPSYEEVKTAIGKDTDLTVIKKINANFGKQIFIAEVVVYDSKEAKNKVETIPKKVRKKIAEEKKTTNDTAKKAKTEAKKAEEETKNIPIEEVPVEEPIVEEKNE